MAWRKDRSPARAGSVAEVEGTHGLRQGDDLHAHPVAHGPVGLLWVGTASLHHLQLFSSFPYAQNRGPAEFLARDALLHLAGPAALTLHA